MFSTLRRAFPRTVSAGLFALLALVLSPGLALAGGTPDPGTSPLLVDSGDPGTLPDNENQLLGQLGPNREFFTGDYVTDSASGLQRTPGEADRDGFYRFGIEVPPDQTTLVVEIFDGDIGASSATPTGIDNHDQNDEGSWETTVIYELVDPSGGVEASITLPPQDCDPVTVGLQTACDNAWTTFPGFSVAMPDPGHWILRTRLTDPAGTQDDNNSFGVRAHDGDSSSGGTEYPVYAQSYIGLGHVYGPSGAPDDLSRTHDLFPYVTQDCSCDLNDFDLDDSGDESASLTPPRAPMASFDFDMFSTFTNWNQNTASGFTTETAANNYGVWNLRWIVGTFNFFTFYMGNESTVDPFLVPAGAGADPDTNPLADAIRLYLPADGSRFFGERGGADDVIVPPLKPWVGQSYSIVSGADPITAGVTSRVRVTITIDNPTAFPIQFEDGLTGRVISAHVPTNGGQTAYVTGSAAINGNTSFAAANNVGVTGTGPWDITFGPGVVEGGLTGGTAVTLTYEVDVTPTAAGTLAITGAGAANGTTATYLDESCAALGGEASDCSVTAQTVATQTFGPLCELEATVSATAVIGVAKRVSAGPTSNGDGTFDVSLEFLVENLGTTDLTMVQVTDDLTATFPAPATFSVSTPLATGTLFANAGFDGDSDQDLLVAASSSLTAGMTAMITLDVTFDPNGLPGPFFNQANASGNPITGGTVGDPSDDGTDPDPNGNGNPDEAGENDPTPIPITESPGLLLTKSAGMPSSVSGDVFDVAYTVIVQNTGDVDLTVASVVDDLTTVFTAPASLVSIDIPPAVMNGGGATLVANALYDGDGDTNLITGGLLPVGATSNISYTARFDSGGGTGPFVNTATASATSPQSTPVGDSDTASVTVAVTTAPQIGLAKAVTDGPNDNGDSTYTVSLRFVVENLGGEDLTDVQVVDDLSATFGAPASVVSVTMPAASVTSGTGTLVANAAYDGTVDTDLLDAAASSLDIGAIGEITVDVTFDPGGLTSFVNTATTTADGSTGSTSDTSDDGAEPDFDGDGNPDEVGENDPTPIRLGTIIDIPTIDPRGIAALVLLLLGAALVSLRRQG